MSPLLDPPQASTTPGAGLPARIEPKPPRRRAGGAMLAAVIVVTLLLAYIARRVEKPNALHIALAVLAVLLWIGIIFAGRLIAYIEAT